MGILIDDEEQFPLIEAQSTKLQASLRDSRQFTGKAKKITI